MEILNQEIGHQMKLVIKQQPQIFLTAYRIHRHRRCGCVQRTCCRITANNFV